MKTYKNTIESNESIYETFPALIIIKREPNEDGLVEITSNDRLTFCQYGNLGQYAAMDSAEYYLEVGFPANEIQARVKSDWDNWGEGQYSIINLGSCLTATKKNKEVVLSLSFGQKVLFNGKVLTVAAASNHNAKLV